jgi:2-dehydro-3-deoxyphosphogluconate aldolase/(4S)-4-hydroxy-2-oxoglutarate aldolase
MTSTLEQILRDGFILVYNSTALDVVATARALQAAGICNMEVTCRIPDALGKIRRLKTEVPGFRVGGASLLDAPQSRGRFNRRHSSSPLPSPEDMVEAGADYLVSAAGFRAETYARFAGRLPLIPGCGTVSEIVQQYEMGASFCKLFPAAQCGGSEFIKAMDPAIHKMISLMPTGGTSLANIPDYVKAGCLVLGGSFSMIESATLKRIEAEQDYASLAVEFAKVKALIDECRRRQYPDLDFRSASQAEIEAASGRIFG